MKRRASHSLKNQRIKRTRLMEYPVSFNSLPFEIWIDNIISLYPKDWLGVSKEWHDKVIPILFQDPRIKKCPLDFGVEMIKLGHISTIKIILKYFRANNSYFDTAIEHNQLEIMKILISNEIRDTAIDRETRYFSRLIDGSTKYGNVDILENIYSEFQFTADAKKGIMVNIIPSLAAF